MGESERRDFLMRQYHECAEQYRLHNRQFWQMPSVSILIISAIVGVSYGYVSDFIARTFLLLMGTCTAFAVGIAMIKLRFFQYGIVLTLEKIEGELNLENIQWTTGSGPNKPRNWLEKRRAYNCFICVQFLMSALLAILFILSVITTIQTYCN
ncbi:MAG: hypothetical protein QXV21_06040 [Candidatus Bathyarchaeia archaeon]